MNPQTWRRVEQLYHAALERTASERPAFLDDACAGDEALRREVEKLVAGHEEAGAFLDSPAWDVAETVAGPAQPESLVGKTIGSYKVLSSIGSGGMGEVYLAEDTRLGRKIALKVLPARFTQDPDRVRRFEQEVRAASALNHPNIITVHDIGETEAGRFIAMELVAGRTLRALADNHLPLDAVVRVGRQIAEALAVAHAAGIVHRDIKPENIMMREDGYVKVLDFGLVRLVASDVANRGRDSVWDTRPGVLLGTMHYMSPEQARGEAVGTATDIFSLGILLYELATGQHPFKADSQISVLHGIVSTVPLPPRDLAVAISVPLNDLILHMLDKDARLRPAASAVAATLSALTVSSGVRETATEPTVAARLGAPGVLRNRLARVASLILLSAVATGAALWLLRDRASPSAITSPVATGPGAPTPAPRPRLSSGGPASSNPEANRLFENAMLVKVNLPIQRARELLDRALELDPQFAEARAWKAFTNFLILDFGYANESGLLNQAESEMRRALQDEPTLARAHTGIAAVYLMQGRREQMAAELDQALKANADDEDALFFLMQYHHYAGEYDAAEPLGRRILQRLPLFGPARFILGYMREEQGDPIGAIREYGRILELDPQNGVINGLLARTYVGMDDLLKARQHLERVGPADRQTYWMRLVSAILLAREGHREQALKEVDEQVLKWGALVAYLHAEVAGFYAVIGDAPTALDWLDRAVRGGDERAEWFRRDPLLAKVHAHPRFQQILDSIAYRRQQRKPVQ